MISSEKFIAILIIFQYYWKVFNVNQTLIQRLLRELIYFCESLFIFFSTFNFFWRCWSEQATKCWLVDFDFYLVVSYWTDFFPTQKSYKISDQKYKNHICQFQEPFTSNKIWLFIFFIGGINKILKCELLLDERTVGLFMFCFYLDCFRYMADFWV